jgi:hypothetical protein
MTDLMTAARDMLMTVDMMLDTGEWYSAHERADALRAALETEQEGTPNVPPATSPAASTATPPKMQTRIMSVAVAPVGARVFDELVTTITIADDAAGEYLEISQTTEDKGLQIVCIDPSEWSEFASALDNMMRQCRPVDANG